MKRVTYWPQAFLGLVFSWGALVGWTAVTGEPGWPMFLLYAGCVLWVLGYDTIYALQDVDDDALIGVRSTARLFGARSGLLVAASYCAAAGLWAAAALAAGAGIAFFIGLVPVVGLLGWQVATLDAVRAGNALARFKANHWVGALLTLAIAVSALG